MLFEEIMEPCVMMDKTSVPDGQGGFDYQWEEGAGFGAAIVKNNSLNARIAEKDGLTELYTITVYKNTPLDFNDVIKRLSDGAIFKITSNMVDSETPNVASFQFGQVNAKRWVLE